jgi:two-component system LytT family response regulator
MIRAIIIDDESRARSALKQEITLNCPEVMIVGEADSVQSSVELIKKVVPELIISRYTIIGWPGISYFRKSR